MTKKLAVLAVVLLTTAALTADDAGAAAAKKESSFTLDEMLLYAFQDEHLALAEYEAIQEEFGAARPYSNIALSEKTHISYLEELYSMLGMGIPSFDASSRVTVPSSLLEAAEIGVQAEVDNIAMYERFLNQDLPDEVRDVFVFLKEASEKHLVAFERQVDRGAYGQGRALLRP